MGPRLIADRDHHEQLAAPAARQTKAVVRALSLMPIALSTPEAYEARPLAAR